MTPIVEISRARVKDRHGICRVHKSSITILCGRHYSATEIEDWIGALNPDHYLEALRTETVFVARVGNRIVGFAQMRATEATIEALYVHPRHVRHGTGTKLLVCLENEARTSGRELISLDATLNSVPFFLLRGYLFLSEGARRASGDANAPRVKMEKRLQPGGIG